MVSRSNVIAKINRLRAALDTLEQGFNEHPVSTGDGEGYALIKHAQKVGIELVSETAARKQGYKLKKGAKPILFKYFKAPIQKYIPLYDLHSQFVMEKRRCPD